ncbi:tRNA uridine(34) hydroxylase-like [Scyliorhinus torazame]|uniref:tRNA uridine(34) hydroxylase-like n=1 Tax=Scyliorhinus torazame TaxID=75743 RepID=UPI003B58D558
MEPVIWWIRKSFSSVQDLSSDATEQLIVTNQNRILLLDVRSPAEYQVSHLQGAIRVDPETTNMGELVKTLGLEDSHEMTEVVCYCTVGYRSSKVAQKLLEFLASDAGQGLRGPLKVYNLEGGLVKWANERKAIVDSENQPTNLVHPYSTMWGQLLEPAHRARI